MAAAADDATLTVDRGWIDRLDELHLLTPIRIVAILVIALLLTWFLQRVVKRLLVRTVDFADRFNMVDQVRLQARQRALASALRSAMVGVVWAIVVVTVVSELGINIGAFVATATVVGGAVAFGAQTLIRDVIAGFFVLAEDQYGVGDTVDLGHATGSVERITLRTARLRDAEGKIWFVPHGGVLRVANLSKSSAAVVDLEVGRAMALDDVMAVGGTILEQLQADQVIAPLLAGKPTVVGITEVRDDRLVVRLKAPTAPNKQDEVRRALRVLVLRSFGTGALVAPTQTPTAVVFRKDATTEPE